MIVKGCRAKRCAVWLLSVVFVGGLFVFAQKTAHWSFLPLAPMGMHGGPLLDDYVEVHGQGRWQWVGMPGAPTTYLVSGSVPLPVEGWGTLGQIQLDRAGPLMAFQVGLGGWRLLSVGEVPVRAGWWLGVQHYRSTPCDLTLPSGRSPCAADDPAFVRSPTVSGPGGFVSVFVQAMDVPVYWLWTLSVQRVVEGAPRLAGRRVSEPWVVAFSGFGPLFAVNEVWDVWGAFSLYSSRIQVAQAQIQVYGRARDRLWVGLSWRGFTGRTLESAGFIIGVTFLDRYRLFYTYELPVGVVGRGSRGSHEVLLQVRYPVVWRQRVYPIIFSPRFL